MKPNILYLAHCLPTQPDKGERIRAYHELRYLTARYNVHVVCTGRNPFDLERVKEMRRACASFRFEPINEIAGFARAAFRFLLGSSLTLAFYHNARIQQAVRDVCREVRFDVTVAFSTAMAPYAPVEVPLLLDMVDVDSAKWASYGEVRRFKWLYRQEAARLRAAEQQYGTVAKSVLLTSMHEVALLKSALPAVRATAVLNGVDGDYFNPEMLTAVPKLPGRQYITMVGAMSYFPNSDAAVWFTGEVLPRLRAKSNIEFFVVGHSPTAAVQRLAHRSGVTVTGSVPDVRPYIADASAVVVPLRIARGVQNKVLEALAMGKPVLASPAVAATFGQDLPPGITVCRTADDYVEAILSIDPQAPPDTCIRNAVISRYRWDKQMAVFDDELQICFEGRRK